MIISCRPVQEQQQALPCIPQEYSATIISQKLVPLPQTKQQFWHSMTLAAGFLWESEEIVLRWLNQTLHWIRKATKLSKLCLTSLPDSIQWSIHTFSVVHQLEGLSHMIAQVWNWKATSSNGDTIPWQAANSCYFMMFHVQIKIISHI